MCGITVKICRNASKGIHENEWDELVRLNAQRGPSAQGETMIQIEDVSIKFFCSVLHLRGDQVTKQPHEQGGSILCWNGEIFEGMDIPVSDNDGSKLFDRLCNSGEDLITILGQVEGPYAFVYYKSEKKTLYFGRDPLGRRSLLLRKGTGQDSSLILASVSTGNQEYVEVSPEHIYSLSLESLGANDSIVRVPRDSPLSVPHFIAPAPLLRDLPATEYPVPSDPLSDIWQSTVSEYIERLEESVALRTHDIPRITGYSINPARVAVLFSGGIDSSVIAFLAHRHVPLSEPIDLLNVAFENPRTLTAKMEPIGKRKRSKKVNDRKEITEQDKYMVPDRITGRAQVAEFRKLAPERKWNFVEIDVTYEEATRTRAIIEQLMAPSRTIMDLSLAQALYFASRGKGVLRDSHTDEVVAYKSTARVILSGLGADELLGGYIRHRNAFKHAHWQGLLDELQMDVDRIHTRNLGRDDRIIASHGKEARYPFLSSSLLSYLSSLPIYLKIDPRVLPTERGSVDDLNGSLSIAGLPGDKLLHRLAARKLGLIGAAGRAKRAMQFGSRSARMEEGESKKLKGGATLE